MIEPERQDAFSALIASSDELDSDVRSEERAKRRAFTRQVRGSLQRLMGFPLGLPDMDALELNRVHHLEGSDLEVFLRTWTRHAGGPRLLHVSMVTAEVDLEFESLLVRHQSLALQAFEGTTYEYVESQMLYPGDEHGPRSPATRRMAGLPAFKASIGYDDDPSELDHLRSFPASPINRLGNFTQVALMDEVATRRRAELQLLPMLEKLDYSDLRNVPLA